MISRAHTPSQRQLLCRLGAQGLASPAIVVIGDVVRASPMWAEQLVDTAWPPAVVALGAD